MIVLLIFMTVVYSLASFGSWWACKIWYNNNSYLASLCAISGIMFAMGAGATILELYWAIQ